MNKLEKKCSILIVYSVAISIICLHLLNKLDTEDIIYPKCSDFGYISHTPVVVMNTKSKILSMQCI